MQSYTPETDAKITEWENLVGGEDIIREYVEVVLLESHAKLERELMEMKGRTENTPREASSALTDFEKGPWSYDLYAGGLEPVGLLNDHADEAQGEWVSIEDYRRMEHERDMARAAANTFRQCAEVTFGVMPFPRKFHWENA